MSIMSEVMTDFITDLRERFDWAMYQCLEAYTVLPDGKSFERSDEDEYAIGAFERLLDSIDAIPPSLIQEAEEVRAAVPELFDKLLVHGVRVIGPRFSPSTATEFIEILNQTVQRDMPIAPPKAITYTR
jgi:hypothetical protein